MILKAFRGIRNHWKKSLFAAGLISYGVSYANEKYETSIIMRSYCEEASKYGDVLQNVMTPPKRVVVILNPAANKRSAEKTFEKYCEPILQLAGIIVDVVKTDSEGHARRYIEELNKLPDAILVAGGDGTISETITGLMRRESNDKCPIGVLPLGRTNKIANNLYGFPYKPTNLEQIRGFAESAISVVRGKTKDQDIMKIQVLTNKDEKTESPPKPIFAMGSVQWGAFRDVETLKDKYWYVGPLREYVASLLNAFNDDLTWNCDAQLLYTPPCSGCNNCFTKEIEKQQIYAGRWWSRFIPKFKLGQQAVYKEDYSKVRNDNCTKLNSMQINPTEILLTANDKNTTEIPDLKLKISGLYDSGFDFISENWNRISTNNCKVNQEFSVRTVELLPEKISTEEDTKFYSIDSEAYEVRPIRISLVPKAINMYSL